MNVPDLMIEMLDNGNLQTLSYMEQKKPSPYQTDLLNSVLNTILTDGALWKDKVNGMISNFASQFNDEDTADLCCSINQERVHVH